MKTKNLNNKKILMLGTALVSINAVGSVNVASAATATTSAVATIVAAISLTNTTNLHFGRIVPAVGAGTAIISPAGVLSYTGGVADGGSVGVAQAAGFTIDGTQGVDIQVTAAPAPLTATFGPSMALSTIKYSLGPTANTDTTTFQIPTTATAPLTLNVGGTLAVGTDALQTQGAYTGSIVLTANYN